MPHLTNGSHVISVRGLCRTTATSDNTSAAFQTPGEYKTFLDIGTLSYLSATTWICLTYVTCFCFSSFRTCLLSPFQFTVSFTRDVGNLDPGFVCRKRCNCVQASNASRRQSLRIFNSEPRLQFTFSSLIKSQNVITCKYRLIAQVNVAVANAACPRLNDYSIDRSIGEIQRFRI